MYLNGIENEAAVRYTWEAEIELLWVRGQLVYIHSEFRGSFNYKR